MPIASASIRYIHLHNFIWHIYVHLVIVCYMGKYPSSIWGILKEDMYKKYSMLIHFYRRLNVKVTHYIKNYTFSRHYITRWRYFFLKSLYQFICLNIIRAQLLKYRWGLWTTARSWISPCVNMTKNQWSKFKLDY